MVLNNIDLSEENQELVAKFLEAAPWFCQWGTVGNRERIAEFEAACKRLQGNGEKPGAWDFLNLAEIETLVNIWEHRERLQDLDDLPNRIKQTTGGRRFYSDEERAPPFSRNFTFELECGCLLLDAGLPLVAARGDLAARLPSDRLLLAECKQPTGGPDRQYESVERGSAQLQEHRVLDETGIIFLDLSIAANLDLNHFQVETEGDSMETILAMVRENREHLTNLLTPALRPLDSLILVKLEYPFWILSKGGWVIQSRWFSLMNPKAEDKALQDAQLIMERLAASI